MTHNLIPCWYLIYFTLAACSRTLHSSASRHYLELVLRKVEETCGSFIRKDAQPRGALEVGLRAVDRAA